jgi:hypothetical protein
MTNPLNHSFIIITDFITISLFTPPTGLAPVEIVYAAHRVCPSGDCLCRCISDLPQWRLFTPPTGLVPVEANVGHPWQTHPARHTSFTRAAGIAKTRRYSPPGTHPLPLAPRILPPATLPFAQFIHSES